MKVMLTPLRTFFAEFFFPLFVGFAISTICHIIDYHDFVLYEFLKLLCDVCSTAIITAYLIKIINHSFGCIRRSILIVSCFVYFISFTICRLIGNINTLNANFVLFIICSLIYLIFSYTVDDKYETINGLSAKKEKK